MTKYRCGECKLRNETVEVPNWKPGMSPRWIWKQAETNSHEEMLEHLAAEHQVKPLSTMSDLLGWGVCDDCGEYFRGDHLPIGYESAGGTQMWCYDCAQNRCLRAGPPHKKR